MQELSRRRANGTMNILDKVDLSDEEDDFAGENISKSMSPKNDDPPEASVSASKALTFDDLKLLLGRD